MVPLLLGENLELKQELNSDSVFDKREALRRIIANVTLGKDVSFLFPDVIKCIQTEDLEIRKLVYLYLMNYANSHPDLVILSINSFCKDIEHPNPLIRALAIRTMGCLNVDTVTDYLCIPLKKSVLVSLVPIISFQDKSAYVRKTAALGIAKINAVAPQLIEDHSFKEILLDLIFDPNPNVNANAISALSEISEASHETGGIDLNFSALSKLLSSLNECTEWGQIGILDALTTFIPSSDVEAASIIDKVYPRLQHSNPSVVISTIKILLVQQSFIKDEALYENTRDTTRKKLMPILKSLLNHSYPEIQYLLFTNLSVILNSIFAKGELAIDFRIFFCMFNDPLYVKFEKLSALIACSAEDNFSSILDELEEYSKDIDQLFSLKAIQAIGSIGCKSEKVAPRCISFLISLLKPTQSPSPSIVEQSIVSLKKYHTEMLYLLDLEFLFSYLNTVLDPEAKNALAWFFGEFCYLVVNIEHYYTLFLCQFLEETHQTQGYILDAFVKASLLLGDEKTSSGYLKDLFEIVLNNVDVPSIRDRAFIYWRVLSLHPELAKETFLDSKQALDKMCNDLPTEHKAAQCKLIGSIASMLPEQDLKFSAFFARSAVFAGHANRDSQSEFKIIDVDSVVNLDSVESASSLRPLRPDSIKNLLD
ncbi:subunit beta of AP-2 complex [Mitosporidium daphniae]|uniref:AP complex subunit beta n=1 Tax=Mitosporidium daphniae TaxID=1485682 RepID=A0A098VTB1_9MICR|nr:subunit beta of AP-2 complex [Mitosporidium daphniae]KGG52323.1 subunit beta of AP-2 complex [Mitosporidium daphniae]|eukprot:XP_013238750.1 subunit beta of AP-2 complex [Mitosporidium daphniae]